MNIANNLALTRPHPTIEISLGAGLPKLSDGCNINRKTRPYKLFNEFGASYQVKQTAIAIRLNKQRSPLGSLERDRLTFSFFSGIIFIVGKYVRLETKFRFGVS
jgi:hypothetical protein